MFSKRKEVDLKTLAQIAKDASLTAHLLDRIRDYAARLKKGELDKIWFSTTGTRLPYTEKRGIAKFFTNLFRNQ